MLAWFCLFSSPTQAQDPIGAFLEVSNNPNTTFISEKVLSDLEEVGAVTVATDSRFSKVVDRLWSRAHGYVPEVGTSPAIQKQKQIHRNRCILTLVRLGEFSPGILLQLQFGDETVGSALAVMDEYFSPRGDIFLRRQFGPEEMPDAYRKLIFSTQEMSSSAAVQVLEGLSKSPHLERIQVLGLAHYSWITVTARRSGLSASRAGAGPRKKGVIDRELSRLATVAGIFWSGVQTPVSVPPSAPELPTDVDIYVDELMGLEVLPLKKSVQAYYDMSVGDDMVAIVELRNGAEGARITQALQDAARILYKRIWEQSSKPGTPQRVKELGNFHGLLKVAVGRFGVEMPENQIPAPPVPSAPSIPSTPSTPTADLGDVARLGIVERMRLAAAMVADPDVPEQLRHIYAVALRAELHRLSTGSAAGIRNFCEGMMRLGGDFVP